MSEPADWTTRYRSSEYIFVMMSIGEELCANTRPRSNDGRKQIGMFLAARARGLSRRHSREHQSSISVYWPQDDEFTVTRMSTALTRPKLMLSRAMYYEHFASSPIQRSPLTRRDQSSRKWKNKCPNGAQTSVLYRVA